MRRGRKYDHREFKDKVLEAFTKIRKYHIYARTNFMCCRSCAGYDLHTKAKDHPEIIGCVFYCKQSEERLKGTPVGKGDLYLSFGATDAGEKSGLTTIDIGKLLVVCLQDAGLHPEWDGTANKSIYVSEEVEERVGVSVEDCLTESMVD